jgi:hypothetical protein
VPAPAPTAAATLSEPTLSLPSPVPADQFRTLLDERFATNTRGWPTDPQGTAWLASGAFNLAARRPTQFVAVRIPGAEDLGDVVVSASFRKLGGPNGGGYGLILRDQGPGPRDGLNQTGRFYVFEIGDKGELGIWLRDFDHWVDLLTWTPSEVVRPGTATNELTVSAIGDRLSFMVNGEPVASQLDTVLHRGAAGIFTGGDGNQVVVNRVIVRVPR